MRGGAGPGGVRVPHRPGRRAKRWVEAELLDELVDCYEALGRVDEAITVMRRALQVGLVRANRMGGAGSRSC